MKVAVVGAGVSGSSILKAILTHPNFNEKIAVDVYEPRAFLGTGLPYDPTDDESIMLNIAPDVLSVVEDNPNDFVEWLEENYEEPTNFEDLVSRPRYGKYLAERFAPYYNHEQVTHIQNLVEDLEVLDRETRQPANDKQDGQYVYRLKTDIGWHDEIYDAVFFAVGHPEYNDFYNLKVEQNYVHNPYPMKQKLMGFDNNQKISVIGSGATGIDLMRFFSTNYNLKQPLTFYDIKEPFHFVNIPYEKDDFTYSISMDWIEQEKVKHDGFIPLQVIFNLMHSDLNMDSTEIMAVYNYYKSGTLDILREAFDTKDQKLAAIQKYASETVTYLPALYNALNQEDRKEYFENYYDIMLFFKAKVPYLSYKWLFELLDAGKLETVAGLKEVKVLDNGRFQLVTEEGVSEADVLVNATGFNQNLVSLAKDSLLIHNLLNKRIILPHTNDKFVLIDWPKSHVLNQRFGVMENLFFLGLLIGGTQHENNDAGLTIRHAQQTANAFMDNLNR